MSNKILLIISREYITRVRKPSFWVLSLAAPILLGALIFVPIWLASMEGEQKVVAVLSELAELRPEEWDAYEGIVWVPVSGTLEGQQEDLKSNGYYALLHIPPNFLDEGAEAVLYAESGVSLDAKMNVRRVLQRKAEKLRLNRAGIDKATLQATKERIQLRTASTEKAEADDGTKTEGGVSPEAASGVGYFAAFLIYFFIFFFGAQVMRGVVEEKSSRIVEVIISSVRPFELMLGKIVGIGGVALTQFAIWVVLVFGIQIGISLMLGPETMAEANAANQMSQADTNETIAKTQAVMGALSSLNIPVIVGSLLFYFLGAYLFYGALFAAVGAISDTDTDTQQYSLPISLPLIISIMIAVYVIREPQGTLAFWTSIIPFTSPIVMMTRIPFGVPTWELLLSMALLIGGFLGATWLAGKIYRIGILWHGKKVSYSEIARWIRQKN